MKKQKIGGNMNVAELLSAVKQELKDFKEESLKRLERIECQTIRTNGRVSNHDTIIEVMKNESKNCPAKKMYELENKSTKHARFAMYITIIINLILLYMSVFLKVGGK